MIGPYGELEECEHLMIVAPPGSAIGICLDCGELLDVSAAELEDLDEADRPTDPGEPRGTGMLPTHP